MPTNKEKESIDDILEQATMEYGKLQDQIDALPRTVSQPGSQLKPVGAPDFSVRTNPKIIQLQQLQQHLTNSVDEKASSLAESLSPELANDLKNKVKNWKTSDIQKQYKELMEDKNNPISASQKKILKDHADTINNTDNKTSNNSEDRKYSMSDKFTQSLHYQETEKDENHQSKSEISKDFQENKEEIEQGAESNPSMSMKWEQQLGFTKWSDPTTPGDGNKTEIKSPEIDLDKKDD